MMYRANIPAELDVLDSPLLSSTPMGSASLGSVPGSALAERIFNDPCSWETCEEFPTETPADPMAWFVEEVERFRTKSVSTSSTDTGPKLPVEKVRLMPSPASTLKDARLRDGQFVDLKRRNIRPISLTALFDRSGDDFVRDIQSHFHKDNSFDRTPSTSDIFTPTTATTSSTISTATTNKSEFLSPAPIYSASTTLSFLDLYLESPGKNGTRKSFYTRSRPQTPSLQITSETKGSRPISLLSPILGHPDMSVEPLEQGSSVPHLDQLPVRTPVATLSDPSPPPSVLSPEPKPSLPPGLPRPTEAKKPLPPVQQAPKTPPKAPSPAPPRSLPRLALPPPYTRTPSPLHLMVPPCVSSSPPQPAVATPTATGSNSSTPIRRLPTIPLSSIPASAAPLASSTTTHTASPLPTSFPLPSLLSPEPTTSPSQVVSINGRPSSAARSPLSGPLGPRSRAKPERSSPPSIKRVSPSLTRRPPGLRL